VANEQYAQAAEQNSFANDLILGVLGLLSAVALVNTLVVTTVERRRVLRLLGRVGATRGQVAAVFGWQAVFVAGTGIIAGAAAGAVTLLTVTRAVTGSWTPFIPVAPAVGLVALVAALTAGAVMIPFGLMSRREPTLASG
jgi:putative ABC transport system permease protein